MVDRIKIATIGALLHDVGKVCIRAGSEKKTHQILGSDFLRPFCEEAEAGKGILRCVRYHHGRDLSAAHLPADDLAYVVYEADNLAAGLDRRDTGEGERSFDWKLSLENVFNVFEGVREKSYYPLKVLDAAEPVNYPTAARPQAGQGAYAGIQEQLRKNFAASEPAASVILSCIIFHMSFVALQVVGIAMVILAIMTPAVDFKKIFRK